MVYNSFISKCTLLDRLLDWIKMHFSPFETEASSIDVESVGYSLCKLFSYQQFSYIFFCCLNRSRAIFIQQKKHLWNLKENGNEQFTWNNSFSLFFCWMSIRVRMSHRRSMLVGQMARVRAISLANFALTTSSETISVK